MRHSSGHVPCQMAGAQCVQFVLRATVGNLNEISIHDGIRVSGPNRQTGDLESAAADRRD